MDLIPSILFYLFFLSAFVFAVTLIAIKVFESIEIKEQPREPEYYEKQALLAMVRKKQKLKEKEIDL